MRGWIGENEICDARRALQFLPLPVPEDSSWKRRPRVAFRRFFFDGLGVGKLEVGIWVDHCDGFEHPTPRAIQYLLNLKVRIRVGLLGVRTTHLINSGDQICQLYLSATTRREVSKLVTLQSWWVTIGQPLVFVYWRDWQHRPPRLPTKEVPLPDNWTSRLYHSTIPHNGKKLPTWFLSYEKNVLRKWQTDPARILRLYLLRLHAEHVCLRLILRNIETDKIPIQRGTEPTELLQFYLNTALKRINRWESKAGDLVNNAILYLARELYETVNPGSYDAILDRLQIVGIRKNVLRNVEGYLRRWANSNDPKVYLTGDIVMGDKYDIKGQVGIAGPNAQGNDIRILNESWDQWIATTDLSILADDLAKLQNEMSKTRTEPQHDLSIEHIARAEASARDGSGSRISRNLKAAGQWALDIATKIGTGVAVEALKRSM